MVLSLAGGALGLLFAYWSLRLLLVSYSGSIPRPVEVGLDGSVLVFTLVISLVTGLVFGLAPVLNLTAHSVGLALREGGQRATAGSARRRLRRLLVASELALAVVLVIGSGLMLRSLWSIQQLDPSFNPGELITFQTVPPQTAYATSMDRLTFYDELVPQLAALPGIDSAAAMSGLPPLRRLNANTMEFEGLEQGEGSPPQNIDYWQFVTTDYFERMQLPIVTGRSFRESDLSDTAPVALLNAQAARVFYPDTNPIGRRIRPAGNPSNPWFTVVGIVNDVKQGGLTEETGTEFYFHYPQAPGSCSPRARCTWYSAAACR